MARYNPQHEVEPIYEAVEQWRKTCLEGNGSVFSDGELWTGNAVNKVYEDFVKKPIVTEKNSKKKKDFLEKLKIQIGDDSTSCKLMAEIIWAFRLYSPKEDMREDTKRDRIREIWSWSGEKFPENHKMHKMLAPECLGGIGGTGRFKQNVWDELKFFITVLRELKSINASEFLGDPWVFAKWFNSINADSRPQFRNMLSHMLFPDTFERVSSTRHKRIILFVYRDSLNEYKNKYKSEKDLKAFDLITIDKMLLNLRVKLEEKYEKIDYYYGPNSISFKKYTDSKPEENYETGSKKNDLPADEEIKNLILYGPPGTGKTRALREEYISNYDDDCYEFVTFHQSYSYEDFIEGIRPESDGEIVKYPIKPGVFKILCQRAKESPNKKFAIFIDEINRGNISKILGELITLIETDKRIKLNESGKWQGMKAKLPYSGDEFGVPANIDIIGTMNSADRSTAVLDSALRRRFKFEKMMPDPSILETIPDGKNGEINLAELLNKMNERIIRLLHEDQTIGHSYFCGIKTFDQLKNVFVYEILPLLQEYFYDDYEQIKLVLDSQLVETLPTNAKELFPNSENVNLGGGKKIKIVSSDKITPEAIRAIYEEQNDLPNS